jgi:TonB family protein
VRWSRGPLLLVLAWAACATAPPTPTASAAQAAQPPSGPPPGTGRLASSLACEPTPRPADGAGGGTATGDAASRNASYDRKAVLAFIHAHGEEARACYDGIAAAQPGAQGRVMVRFGISPSGAVQTSCVVSSDLQAPSVDACLLERVLTWQFPAVRGGGWVVINYPFIFVRPKD